MLCVTLRGPQIMPDARRRWEKVREWLHRYGLAECAGITCALLGSFAVRHVGGSAIAAAYAAAWAESIGYASVVITKDLVAESRRARAGNASFGFGHAHRVGAGLLAEFGPSGILDTFVTRPLAMALGTRFLGPELGVVAGKISADIVFYLPVIFIYEHRKRLRERAPQPRMRE
jgi:hypothetical protein